jgi:hypothetical protein
MILVATAGVLVWILRQVDRSEDLYILGPLFVIMVPFLYGMAWSIVRIYRNPPERQTSSIVILIGSLLGWIFCSFLYFLGFGVF